MSFVLLLSDDKTHLADLNSLHDFIHTFYLERHDAELEELRAEQRPGRPKSKQLMELQSLKEKEKREYYEGMDVPDLMNEINVAILREWQGDPQALHLFRFIRVSSADRYVAL
ncbi:translation machinery-associated protein 16 [Malassezia yamatoensis]|uniref:Translation machinery-associated protein 16 n=1 Tax=Malassezia yamatoensis TaxID=253288 RepID=A0AAJ5YXY9_9BASI|nr:translation machinery-associated protein 16 [Malassezia yamatoensis]